MPAGASPEPFFHSLSAGPKGTVPLRRRLRRHATRTSHPDVDELRDEPMFSRAELSGSGFDALMEELEGSLTLDLSDEDE